ncbi:hypothetical protein LEAN103870_02775 [Legionella anisa]|nr:hypothetical protein Lani_1546 [Legionella anisa]
MYDPSCTKMITLRVNFSSGFLNSEENEIQNLLFKVLRLVAHFVWVWSYLLAIFAGWP